MITISIDRMLNKFKNFLKTLWKECINFLHYARDHRINVHPKDWFKGVGLLLIGWGFLAMDNVLFEEPLQSINSKINFIIEFSTGIIIILLIRYFYKILKPKKLSVWEFLKISHANEISGLAILPPKTRKLLIFTRGVIGAGGYICFQLAKVAAGIIDNSILYGADSFMFVFLSIVLLHDRYNLKEWMGILLMTLGISVIVVFDLFEMNKALAIKGSILGGLSSLSLAIILILTSVIVQHDHPVRIVFYHCICGLFISILFAMFSFSELFHFNFENFDFSRSLIEGLFYTFAVILLLQAFYYVHPIIVAISSYSLDLYSILFNYFINNEIIEIQSLMSTILIVLGSWVLIRAEYRKYKNTYTIQTKN